MNSKTWKLILRLALSKWPVLGLVLLIIVIYSIGIAIAPMFLGIVIDNFLPQLNSNMLLFTVIVLALVYLIIAITNYLQIMLMGRIGQFILFELRKKIFVKLNNVETKFYYINESGDLISRIISDTNRINNFFSEGLIRFIANLFSIVGIITFLIINNLQLATPILVIAIILMIVIIFLNPISKNINKEALDKEGELSAYAQDTIYNFKIIYTFNAYKFYLREFTGRNEASKKANTKSNFINGIITLSIND